MTSDFLENCLNQRSSVESTVDHNAIKAVLNASNQSYKQKSDRKTRAQRSKGKHQKNPSQSSFNMTVTKINNYTYTH